MSKQYQEKPILTPLDFQIAQLECSPLGLYNLIYDLAKDKIRRHFNLDNRDRIYQKPTWNRYGSTMRYRRELETRLK